MPNHLLTAVAFEGLGHMVSHFGAYKHLVQEMLGAFREAVFTDAPAVETDVLAAADAGRHGVEIYYDAIPYYQKCAELSKAIAAIKLERDTMEVELKRVTQRAAEEVEKAHRCVCSARTIMFWGYAADTRCATVTPSGMSRSSCWMRAARRLS